MKLNKINLSDFTCCPSAIKRVKYQVSFEPKNQTKLQSKFLSRDTKRSDNNLRPANAKKSGCGCASGCSVGSVLFTIGKILGHIFSGRESIELLDHGVEHFWHGYIACQMCQISRNCTHSGNLYISRILTNTTQTCIF